MARQVPLKSAEDVRVFLSVLIREAYNDKIDYKKLNALTTSLNALLAAIRTDDLEQRLQALEEEI